MSWIQVITVSSGGFCHLYDKASFIKIGEFYNQLIHYYRVPQIFQKSKGHLKILGATTQNIVAPAIWCKGFLHSS